VANQLGAIKHIVTLMLENRSFDQMLGFLYESSGNASLTGQPYDGLTGKESNPDEAGRSWPVFKIDPAQHTYFMPGADPGEGFQNTSYQLFRTDAPKPGQTPTNDGFVMNFKAAIASDLAHHFKDSLPGTQPGDIMGMYAPESLPVMSALAKGFAVCDRWFAPAPTQTIPNRAFANAATSQGHLDNHVKVFTCPSIFGLLSQSGLDWAIYGYNRDPLTRLDFTDTQRADESHFGHFRDFQQRCADGTLPEYTFLEPSWSADGNSQHPNYDVSLGDQLMRDVYCAVRNGPRWNDTLLVITYDEHGGNFDHVPPPWGAAAPDDSVGEFGFDFTRFGVRVPALLISPRIAAGTVFRARRGVIDHTSVLKTIEVRWGLKPLTERDKAAPDLGDVLTLATPRTDDPLAGITVSASSGAHPNSAEPSLIEKIHASRVAKLPIRNDKGTYDRQLEPSLTSSAEVGEYIQSRTAAWTQHLERERARHGKAALQAPETTAHRTARRTKAKGRKKSRR
jgi:phospholipase C